MRRCRRAIAASAAAALVLGVLTVVSGLVPITASSGHWPVTAWLLHFTMRRSVATHALGIEVPPLDARWLAQKGASHYETACRGCHGAPGEPLPKVARHMTPHPPSLTNAAADWKPAELFYVVKHGVKFTGMPAWPAPRRDDEVWAMVAFLLELPRLDAEGYLRLARADDAPEASAPAAVRSCARCHGADGRGAGSPAFPRLAGQRAGYLLNALQAFAEGKRPSGIMATVATSLRVEQMQELAAFYGRLERDVGLPREGDARAIERGEAIARRGIASQRVPACAECHGPAASPRNPAYPTLAGQHAEYLMLQLGLFASERRGGSAYAHLMRPVAARLDQAQMRDVALYYESSPLR